jgi:hypothetical protein
LANFRKLQDGVQVYELEEPVTLTVYTKCPMKYKLVDRETGEEYIGQDPTKNKYSWNKVPQEMIKDA